MSQLKVTYFDFPGSRGEECRLALCLAGVDFEDERLKRADWTERKSTTPFGKVPTLAQAGRPALSEVNAILGYIGRHHGLYPKDAWDAARCDMLLSAGEDLRGRLAATLRIEDESARREARLQLAQGLLPEWGAAVEAQLAGPYAFGESPTVADIKLFVIYNWIASGIIDHIPSDVLAPFEKLTGIYQRVSKLPAIAAFRERHATK